jgi:hypothetical protein
MKRPLPCLDLDSTTLDPDDRIKSVCYERYIECKQGVKFQCPNKKGSNGCEGGAFLYPRKRTESYFHFHQGIDLGHLAPGIAEIEKGEGAKGLPIVSVTDGIVVHTQEWDGTKSGYGTAVGIYHRDSERLFWYAHCQANSIKVSLGEEVAEGQTIACVGNTGKAGAPHLHFEVIDSPFKNSKPTFTQIIGKEGWERELGNRKGPRLDPLQVLEELGPWGPRQVFHPQGQPLDPELAAIMHEDVELRSFGGYFPLGANNFWHGGVHLPMPEGSLLHAPCDGTIVAARLAPTAASGTWKSGHTSFILLRHEVSQSVFERMQNGGPAPKSAPKPASPTSGKIGVGYKVTNPEAVNKVKARLYELGYYVPADPARLVDCKVEPELGEAIEEFQLTIPNPYKKKPERWPDGVITAHGHTWDHLFPPEAVSDEQPGDESPESDAKRTIYCLFMHLQPLTLKAAQAAGVEWVKHARLPAGEASAGPEAQDVAPAEDRADREQADAHRIKADVYLGSINTEDIEWVERRLITLGLLTARAKPTGVADADLDAAIKAFQTQHAWPGKSKHWDGVVQKNGKTDKTLRKTAFELAAKETNGGGKSDPIDPALAAALARLDRFGIAEVVSGLSIRVAGGKPLWCSGRAGSFNAGGDPELRQEIHWEVFSEALLFPSWDLIDDKDDDLHADLPATILEEIDLLPDKILAPWEIFAFYQREACHDLRRTACRFRSEWGLDIDRTLSRLEQLQFSTLGVREMLEPYQWWDRASDVLPAGTPHVWHYNPIELFRVYQQLLEGMKPPPPPEPKDPETHGTLIVHVLAANGMPPKHSVTVILAYDMTSYAGEDTDASGTATFHGLAVGSYDLSVLEADEASTLAEVRAYETTELSFATTLEGKPVQRGELTVWVRKPTGGAAVSAQVSISGANLDRDFGTLEVGKQSTVVFRDLRSGEYSLNVVYPANPAHPNERVEVDEPVKFDGKKKKARITVPRGWSDVQIHHEDGNASVEGTLFDEHGNKLLGIGTNGTGLVSLRLRLGKYKVELGGHQKSIDVRLPTMELEV